MGKLESPQEPFINAQGLLEHHGRTFNNESEMMKEIGPDIMEDLETIKNQDLRKTAEKYGVVFVHGTHPKRIPGENSALKDHISWDQKAKIVIDKSPEISSSAIRPGDKKSKFWAPMGVVLLKGIIKYAVVGDGATRVDNFGKRIFQRNGHTLARQIKETLKSDQDYNNEFVVSNPMVAGLFIVTTDPEDKDMYDWHTITYDELMQKAEEFNLPAYAFYKGELYEIQSDEIEIEVMKEGGVDDSEKNCTITEAKQKELYNNKILINDRFVEVSDIKPFRSIVKKAKIKILRLGKKADIYNSENNND